MTAARVIDIDNLVAVRFDTGSGIAYYTISEDGATATRNSKDTEKYRFVCLSPSISEG